MARTRLCGIRHLHVRQLPPRSGRGGACRVFQACTERHLGTETGHCGVTDGSPDWIAESLHPGFQQAFEASEILYRSQTDVQDLVIFENPFFGRILVLDGVIRQERPDHRRRRRRRSARRPETQDRRPRDDGGNRRQRRRHVSGIFALAQRRRVRRPAYGVDNRRRRQFREGNGPALRCDPRGGPRNV